MNLRSERRATVGLAAIGLMAKHWTAGRVKTRLAASIGSQAAADLHRAMLRYLLRQLNPLAARRVLAVAPDHQAMEFVGEAGWRWQITPQGAGSLGARLERLLRLLLSSGDKAVVIGSDCPHVTAATINRGWAELETHDVVLGPAADGGYYLIGLRGPWQQHYSALFADIAWGTERVAEQTRAAATAAELSLAELELEHDVDRPDDLARLLEWLRHGGGDEEFRQAVLAIEESRVDGAGR